MHTLSSADDDGPRTLHDDATIDDYDPPTVRSGTWYDVPCSRDAARDTFPSASFAPFDAALEQDDATQRFRRDELPF